MTLPLTKLGRDVAAGYNADGSARRLEPADFQRLFSEYEALLLALAADSLDIEFPYGFINAQNGGAGTPNAIVATTDRAIPEVDGGALIALPIVATNTASPVTVAFNGGSALTIKTVNGEDPGVGELTSDMIVAGYLSGSTFRLITDPNSRVHKQAAEAAQEAAETAQDAAEAARDLAEGYLNDIIAEKEVPIYTTALGIAPLTLPAGLVAFQTKGYAAAGDGGGAEYSLMDPGDPVEPGELQDAAGRRFRISSLFRTVQMYGAVAGVADHSNAVRSALSARGFVWMPNLGFDYELVGTFTFASEARLAYLGRPTINLNASGNERGFWMPHGVTDAHILGDAIVNLTVNSAGSDGSYNSAFCLGGSFYITGGDPLPCDGCSIEGNIVIDSIGSANGKPCHVYGYVTRWLVKGLTAGGRTNYAFAVHWAGDGSTGVLPAGTWHVDLGGFDDCHVIGDANTLRAFTFSAPGRVFARNCTVNGVQTLGFNVFVGDYGYTYAKNLTQGQMMQVVLEDCEADDCVLPLSIDGISSGLNASPIWDGWVGGSSVHLKGRFRARAASDTVADLMGAQGIRSFTVDNWDVTETSPDGTGSELIKITSVGRAEISGRAVCGKGPLIRNCDEVIWRSSLRAKESVPQASRYGISASAASATTTTTQAEVAGATSITLATVPGVFGIGPGTLLRYTGTDAVEYEVAAKSFAALTEMNVAVEVDPLLAGLASGATITVINTVKSLIVDDCEIIGFAANVRTTGSSTAKPRGIRVTEKVRSLRWGNIGVDLVAAQGFDVRCFMDHGGLAASGNKYGVFLGADAEGGRAGPHIGKNNKRLRYGTVTASGTTDVSLEGGVYRSIDASASNPAAMSINAGSVNTTRGANVVSSGITVQYP